MGRAQYSPPDQRRDRVGNSAIVVRPTVLPPHEVAGAGTLPDDCLGSVTRLIGIGQSIFRLHGWSQFVFPPRVPELTPNLLFAVVAVLFIGISKAGFGGGLGLLTTPLA